MAQEHAQRKLSAGLEREQARKLKLPAWERQLEAGLFSLEESRADLVSGRE